MFSIRQSLAAGGFLICGAALAQTQEASPAPVTATQTVATAPTPAPSDFTVAPGTRIPLTLINSISSKHSAEGDRVYMQTVFPVVVAGRIVIPPGSYVEGTVTHLKRPGRVKGKGELFLRFDSLTLPNGVVRDFRARLSAVDARADEKVQKDEGMIKGDSNKGGDLKTIGEATAAGASIGVIAGSAAKAAGMGAAAGASAGAVAGLLGVLLSRGPDATLAQGTTIEMVLDRPIRLGPGDLNFGVVQPPVIPANTASTTPAKTSSLPHFPF